jgi:class 3 adenylate cyclase
MERLESFVAGVLLQRLRRAEDDETSPACTSFRGAVLFVDISGYTALAEALCNQGSNGIEQLGKTLDLAFRSHVRAVHETAGEIACFAGDAFIAYWPADDGNVSSALRRAHDCARLLHGASRFGVPSSSAAVPALHIGLSAGEIWAARLGAEERWQLLLAGRAVREACAEAARAAEGETAVAPAAEPFLTASLNRRDDRTSTSDSEASTPSQSADLIAHVPRRIQDYVGEGYSAWIPQRRTICALFVRIDGLDETGPAALTRFQEAITSLHVALRPYTGSSGTLLLDDKGLVFTLCFGMPHDAHADDAMRAVRAGLAIRSELARLRLDCAIGVAGGPGVCMPLGGPERRHYWAVGRFMHVAGRLMEAARSGLLCTDDIADRVRHAISLSPERPLTLRGMRRPLHAFRVRADSSIDDQTEVLYGREDEQAKLDQHLDAFENGRGTVLWMVGDAGLGKTALIHYLRQGASRRRIDCLLGGAGSVEIAVGYAAWRPVFATLLADLQSSQSSQEVRLARLGNLRHPQLAPLVNAVIPGLLDETPLVQSLSGQARADATSGVLSEVIVSHATSRFVLVLEDCHWMDSASWRLVLRVAQDHPQALIVLTSRPSADSQELSALRRLDRFDEMKLSPLRSDAIGSLVESVLEGRAANRELVDEITQSSVGNPLFAREYALLLTTRLLQHDFASRLVESHQPADTLPVTVQTLIASRLDALSPSEDLALKTASVIGDRFSADLIANAYPGNQRDESLESILTSLGEKQLIVPAETAANSFVFQHALIREVTYQQLTREQRHDLHRRVAETIERECGDDLRSHVATLAHHWSRAEVPKFTIRYADQAASQALAAGAFEESERLLHTCIDLAKGEDAAEFKAVDRIRWFRQVADARHGMGHLESRRAAAHQALRAVGAPRPQTTLGLAVQLIAHFFRLSTRRVLSTTRAVVETPHLLDVARAYRHSAEVCYFNNDMFGMICDSVSAVTVASALKPSAVLAGASTELGGILSVAGLRQIGERILRRAIATAEAADDQAAQAYAHMISCLYYVGVGDWRSAERSAERCQELCEPMDDRVNWTNAQAVRFWMSHYRSHHAAAYDAARSLRDRASETGNRQHRAWAFRFLGLCALRNDQPRNAADHLQAALDCLGETAALNERIPTLGVMALAQLRSGDVWSARATAKEGLAQMIHVRRPIGHSTLEGYSSLLTVALDAWREEQSPDWRRGVKVCLGALRRYRKGFPVGEARYQLHRGDYRRLSGALRAARRSYRRGEAAASQLGMPWEAQRCREALEQMLGSAEQGVAT